MLSLSLVVGLYFICGYNVLRVCDKKCMELSVLNSHSQKCWILYSVLFNNTASY